MAAQRGENCCYWLSWSRKRFPGLNFACFEAAILIFSPVRGLRPSEAAREATEKVPNPTRRTSLPPLNDSVIDANTASTALLAADFDRSALPATASTSSFLFTCRPLSENAEWLRTVCGAEFRAALRAGQRHCTSRNPAFFSLLRPLSCPKVNFPETRPRPAIYINALQ